MTMESRSVIELSLFSIFEGVALVFLGGLIGSILDRIAKSIVQSLKKKEKMATEYGMPSQKICISSFDSDTSCVHGVSQGPFRFLKNGFSFQYHDRCPISMVPIITAVLTLIVVIHFGISPKSLAGMLCLCFLILLAFTDHKTGYLPDCLTYVFLLTGLIVGAGHLFVSLVESVLGAISGYSVFCALNVAYRKYAGKEGMGHGDFKMMAGLGAWFGWMALLLIVMGASLMAIVVECIKMGIGHQQIDRHFPFGPYLAFAALPILLYGDRLMLILNDCIAVF